MYDDRDLQKLLSALDVSSSAEEQQLLKLLRAPELQSFLALQQAQTTLHTKIITDRMPGGFFVYRAGGDEEILYANRAMARLFGCATVEEFLDLTDHSFRGVVHPEDYPSVEESIEEQIRESQFDLDYVEYRITQKDGTVRWVEDYGHFFRAKEGTGFFYVFVSDATERRERQLAEHSRQLESINQELRRRLKIIEGFSIEYESIFYADLDLDQIQPYQLSRRADYLSLGGTVPFDGFDDAYIQTWVHPDDREALARATEPEELRRRLAHSRSYHVNYRVVDPKGKITHLQLQVADVGEQGGGSQVVLGYRSVDDEILYELEQRELLANALKRSNAAMDAKRTFLSNMSHDIRTPLNAVLGYASLAKRNLEDREKLTACLDQIETAGNQLIHLIEEVLELSQMEDGSLRSQESLCDLSSILQELQVKALPLATGKEIRLSLDLSELQHSRVYADGQKLDRVLMRLVNNAVKYTPKGGQVRVTVSERGAPTVDFAAYTFRVEDNGPGIQPENLSRIFEPFERQQSSTLSGVPGIGLGLTLAKSMAELMGGTLTADSQVGQGSVFTLSLTLRVHTLPTDGPSPAGEAPSARRLLLAEDNELNRELCQTLLEDAGFRVDAAVNGQEAVDRISASPPGFYSLVLMDIQMPVMDGYQAARAIRALPDPARASIPIVALSANALEEDRKRSTESGMNAHCPKPIQLESLLGIIHSLIGSPEEPDRSSPES